MKRVFISIITLICISSAMMAQDNEKFDKEYFEMLKKSGAIEAIDQLPSTMLEQLKQSMPNAPEGMVKEISDTLSASMKGLLTNKLLPYYKKNFTISEIREINKFYETPVGMKLSKMASNMSEVVPELTKDMIPVQEKIMAIVKKWMENKDAK
ncbi:DUF2059 domain-containing protein [Phocaeicola paurosaccharolyticus]|uniref:DUF2059 domain-containing protein n=1 Tax=Phocaeicola paurosaccharolyticus TaxID=732242 RepID=UPI000A07092A|nr:DUF2059 domain-containing protein [Phocaeicola paurosaccharolyticus]